MALRKPVYSRARGSTTKGPRRHGVRLRVVAFAARRDLAQSETQPVRGYATEPGQTSLLSPPLRPPAQSRRDRRAKTSTARSS